MGSKCSYYWWQGLRKTGPAYCSYKDRIAVQRHCEQYCLDGCYQRCKYYNEAVKNNFLELIMDCCIRRGIVVEKSEVYTALNNLRQYLETTQRRLDDITLLIFGDRIGLEIADRIRNSKEASLSDCLVNIYDSYIRAIVDYISCGDYDMAFSWYSKMLDDMIINFCLGQRCPIIKGEIREPRKDSRICRALLKPKIGRGPVSYIRR